MTEYCEDFEYCRSTSAVPIPAPSILGFYRRALYKVYHKFEIKSAPFYLTQRIQFLSWAYDSNTYTQSVKLWPRIGQRRETDVKDSLIVFNPVKLNLVLGQLVWSLRKIANNAEDLVNSHTMRWKDFSLKHNWNCDLKLDWSA